MIEFESIFGDDEGHDWRTVTPIELPDDLPIAPSPSWRKPEWWHTSAAEQHFYDFPEFPTLDDRAAHIVTAMARRTIDATPGADDDTPLFPYCGEIVSLNDLLLALDPILSEMLGDD
jgi:hypothetical protein